MTNKIIYFKNDNLRECNENSPVLNGIDRAGMDNRSVDRMATIRHRERHETETTFNQINREKIFSNK